MAALAVLACEKEKEEIIETPVTPEKLERLNFVIDAIQVGEELDTRTTLVDGSMVHWLPADEIAVFSAGEKARFTSTNTEKAASTQFVGTISVPTAAEGDDAYVWALYPYDANATYASGTITTTLPSAQTGAAGTFGDDLLISASRSLNPFVGPEGDVEFGAELTGQETAMFYFDDDGILTQLSAGGEPSGEGTVTETQKRIDMAFLNVCSGMRFTVDRKDIKSVTLTATGGEPIAGTFTFGYDSNGYPVVKSVSKPSSSVTITAPDGGYFTPGTNYYIVTLPVRFSQGVTFTLKTGTQVGTRTIKSAFSLNRSKFGYKEHLDKPVTFGPDPDVTQAGDFVYATHSVVYDEEFRAMWVATVKKIDFPTTTGAANQQQELIDLFTDIKRMGFNAIVFQVNPMADAFWHSDYLPWSVYLTGTQGKDPGYDPLQLAIDTAHSLGMELHAWFNPLRIGPTSEKRASDHPMFSHSSWYGTYKDSYYWNPGTPEVRTFLGNIMKEVVTKYDVDGTHIDDYFYPNGVRSSAGTWDDSAAYSAYGNGKTLTNWRIYNIDQLVKKYQTVTHSAKAYAVFGAAPGANLDYCHALYAYPDHWMKNGTIDYMAPQVYWDHKRTDGADFNTRLNLFLDMTRADNVHMMVGVAPYMVYDAGSSYYFYHHPEEMLYQVERTRELGLDGTIWFRARYCQRDLLTNYIPQNVYPTEALTPALSQSPASLLAPVVSYNGTKLTWSEVQGADDYVVLKLTRQSSTSKKWNAAIVQSGTKTTFTGAKGGYYIVLARSGSKRSTYNNVVYLPK